MKTLPAEQTTGLTPEEHRAIETFYEAICDGKPDLLEQAVAADWQDIPLAPQQAPGRDGMKPLIESFAAAFSNVVFTMHEVIGSSGRAAVRAEISGKHTGEWFGIEATGKDFRIPLHEFHHLKEGRLTHTWHLEDWFGWLNQVSAWPPQSQGAAS